MEMNYSFDRAKERINKIIASITRCYILLNYAYNTNDQTKKYEEEFQKRYIILYKEIIALNSIINYKFFEDNNIEIKNMLNLDYYIAKMSFLSPSVINSDLGELNTDLNREYDEKTSIKAVKLNFYHNNKYEFGNKTRLHINTIEYGVINPYPNDDNEAECIFSALTNYYQRNFVGNYSRNKKLELKNE